MRKAMVYDRNIETLLNTCKHTKRNTDIFKSSCEMLI